MTVAQRTTDELRAVPALSASIDAFKVALDVSHPHLLDSPSGPRSPREAAAAMLHMYLDTCQRLLHEYDQLTFDEIDWDCPDEEQDGVPLDPEDDIPF